MVHALAFEPLSKIGGYIGRTVVAQQARLVNNFGPVTA